MWPMHMRARKTPKAISQNIIVIMIFTFVLPGKMFERRELNRNTNRKPVLSMSEKLIIRKRLELNMVTDFLFFAPFMNFSTKKSADKTAKRKRIEIHSHEFSRIWCGKGTMDCNGNIVNSLHPITENTLS